MNIHEYQGKSILKSFGVAIQEGIVAETPEQAVAAAKQVMETYKCDGVVVKAQVHAGGRGKGGGVKFAPNLDKVKEVATGYECGLNIQNFNNIEVGDIVESYEQVEVKRKL
jgi:succinyl-CoA synthetase beta subunit